MDEYKPPEMPVGTNTPRPNGLVRGMIRPSSWEGISSGNSYVDALKEQNQSKTMYFEKYDGEKWVRI
jgi:hypothetical protein